MTEAKISPKKAKRIDELGEKYGKRFADEGVSTSQLRRIYSEIKRAETQYRHEDDEGSAIATLRLLRPKLAYEAHRADEMEVVNENFSAIMDKYISQRSEPDLESVFELAEAIVAYHAYYDETGAN